MRFQVLSDIHLEFYKEYPGLTHFINDQNAADCLCLCGDIGDPHSPHYKRFLTECVDAPYAYVFIIAGNHEFYNCHMQRVHNKIRELCKEVGNEKLVYLNNTCFDLPNTNIRVFGATLWSKITEEQALDVRCFIADFRCIKEWDIDENNAKHEKSLKGLAVELSTLPAGKKLIVMSHHAPSLLCGNPIHVDSPISSAFKSDLYDLIASNTHKIAVWMYGHDHHTMIFPIKDTILVSNQVGYPGEAKVLHDGDGNGIVEC